MLPCSITPGGMGSGKGILIVIGIALILWLAHYCVALGPRIDTLRRGLLRMMGLVALFCVLVLAQPDLGGTIVMLLCACATMWVGGVGTGRVVVTEYSCTISAETSPKAQFTDAV